LPKNTYFLEKVVKSAAASGVPLPKPCWLPAATACCYSTLSSAFLVLNASY